MSDRNPWMEWQASSRKAAKVMATLTMLAAEPDCVLWCPSKAAADEWVARGVSADRVRWPRERNGARITFRSLEP